MRSQLSAYIQLLRAPNGITAASNIIAAGVITSGGAAPIGLLWLCLASVCIYYAGMVFNDCFDLKEDSAERPQRPIPSGQVSAKTAWLLGGGLMVTGVGLTALVSTTALYAAIALGLLVIAYDGWVKEGLAGALFMGACRYANWILGASIIATSFNSPTPWLIALPIGLYITGLTYLSKQEVSARDASTVNITAAILTLSLLAVFVLIGTIVDASTTIKAALGLATIAVSYPLFSRIIAIKRQFTPENIQHLIGWMIIAIIPFDAFIVALFGHYGWAAILLCLLPLCRWLSRYAYMT